MLTPSTPSVQKMFYGEYDIPWLLDKAQKELDFAFKSYIDYKMHIANFSVTMASIFDWALAFKPAHFSNCNNLEEVRSIVRTTCPKAMYFIDIANEYKHADRTQSNKSVAYLLENFGVYPREETIDLIDRLKERGCIINSGNNGTSIVVIKPIIIDLLGNEHKFFDCANEAIAWWKSVI